VSAESECRSRQEPDGAAKHATPSARHGERLLPAGVVVAEALRQLATAFREAGIDSPALDARRLVAHVAGIDTVEAVRAPDRQLDDETRRRLLAAAGRRLAREPVSRIIGERYFHGLALEIGPATLDPRPDTEVLVDGVLALVAAGRTAGGPRPRILDLGTGSGAILVALLARLPSATGTGVDVDATALAVARRNAMRHDVATRTRLLQSDWLDAVSGTFDIVVANPPYIPAQDVEGLEPEVRLYDPSGALDGGCDGLAAYRAIAAGVGRVIAPGGWIAVEVGAGQADDVIRLFRDKSGVALETQEVWDDLSGIRRCVAVRARS
jgi:release factor glutamine methyltransferase